MSSEDDWSPGSCRSSDDDRQPSGTHLQNAGRADGTCRPDQASQGTESDPDSSSNSTDSEDSVYGADDEWEVPYDPEIFDTAPKHSEFFHTKIIDYAKKHRFGFKLRRTRKKNKRSTKVIMCDKNTDGARGIRSFVVRIWEPQLPPEPEPERPAYSADWRYPEHEAEWRASHPYEIAHTAWRGRKAERRRQVEEKDLVLTDSEDPGDPEPLPWDFWTETDKYIPATPPWMEDSP